MDIAVNVCQAISKTNNFALRDQITRSALSIPSNIAEGAERPGKAEFRQFLGYAKGSAGELRTQIMIAEKLNLIDQASAKRWIEETREISRMLFGLYRSLG